MSNNQIAGKEKIFPTFSDVYMMRNMTHYEVIEKFFAEQFKRVQCKRPVAEIAYRGEKVTVKTEDGTVYKADYVLVTVSIA
jgi:monoamine oxidase